MFGSVGGWIDIRSNIWKRKETARNNLRYFYHSFLLIENNTCQNLYLYSIIWVTLLVPCTIQKG